MKPRLPYLDAQARKERVENLALLAIAFGSIGGLAICWRKR